MKVKKISYPPINMGISLMLVIFIILSMVIFSVLSLSTALKDYNYSLKNAENTTAYYKASNLAEEKLALLQEDILNYKENEILEYTVAIDETSALHVVLEAHPSEHVFKVNSWKQISTKTWEGDDTLPVYGSQKEGQ